jgi:hypothetical protein
LDVKFPPKTLKKIKIFCLWSDSFKKVKARKKKFNVCINKFNKKKMILLYLDSCGWERDFIVKDVCQSKYTVQDFSPSNAEALLTRDDLVDKCIFVFNHALSTPLITKLLEFLRPKVTMHLSDEFGVFSKVIGQWAHCSQLFLHQYNHAHYSYPSNTLQLPLGYVVGFLPTLEPTNQRCLRETNASFVGTIKSDRREMLNVFTKGMDRVVIHQGNTTWNNPSALSCPPKQLWSLYSQSVFVLCGRGNLSLDCFRVYEAIVAGACPVVVGLPTEIKTTFAYNNCECPVLTAPSWSQALIECQSLLADKEQLLQRQELLRQWWQDVLVGIRQQIISMVINHNT